MKRIMTVLAVAAVMAMVLAVMAAPAMAKKKSTCPEGSTLTTNPVTGEPACQVPLETSGVATFCPVGSTTTFVLAPGGFGGELFCEVEPVSKKELKDK